MTVRHVPLLVRARLASAVAQAAPWGIALDGLLAAEVWASHKAALRAAGKPEPAVKDLADPPDLPLPLARCRTPDGTWHWAATCALPEGRPPRAHIEVRSWTGRLDHRALEHLATDLPKVLSDRQGRFRARNMPLIVTPCTSLVWHAVGDPQQVAEMLTPIIAIGKKRGSGEGQVLSWEVTAQPDLDTWAASHLHPDGTLGRPTPTACLAGHTGIRSGGSGTAGLRPPYMHPGRQHVLHLPALLEG